MSFKGYFVLQRLLSDYDPLIIEKVISSRDNKVEKDYYEEILDLTRLFNVKFFDRNDKFEIDTTYTIAVSWRWLIRTNSKLIILHDSLLPKYRGFSPLVNCLINSENSVGITAIFADEEYDHGDIIAQKELTIKYPVKIFDVIKELTPLYYEIVKEIIDKITKSVHLNSEKQKESNASYSLWRDEDDYKINWEEKASYIRRFIDAVGYPYLGASSYIGDNKVRIIEAEECDDVKIENRTPGKVIFIKNGNPIVVCGEGLLLIRKIVEDANGKSMLPFNKIRIHFK